jgi:23S rRNA U2552 (ribose-2'-O)-methylase RlmE/FtsJ
MANEYELIHSSSGHIFPSIGAIKPISRSYYKLHEILQDMKEELLDLNSIPSRKAAFLADAPGGFVQAFVDHQARTKDTPKISKLHAISLLPQNNYVPGWKLTPQYCNTNGITLYDHHCGPKCKCDLRDRDTTNRFVAHVGPGTCALVTADGGFDFSSDFNDQEACAMALISAEVNTAIQLQAPGGAFILKMYDICSQVSFFTLYVLCLYYDNVFLHKPLTSRPANSEKYVICTGFKTFENNRERRHASRCLSQLGSVGYPGNMGMLWDIPDALISRIYTFNCTFVTNQILSIVKTIAYIEKDLEPRNTEVVHTQVLKALKWCFKYGVPVDRTAFKSYRSVLLGSATASKCTNRLLTTSAGIPPSSSSNMGCTTIKSDASMDGEELA